MRLSLPKTSLRTRWSLRILFLLIALGSVSAQAKLVVYTYDSFTGKGTMGEWLTSELKNRHQVEIEWVAFPSAGEALNQIALEKDKTRADVIVGIDNSLLSRATEMKVLEPLEKRFRNHLESFVHLDAMGTVIPFDYGYLTVLYDERRTKGFGVSPISLASLSTDKRFHKKLVIQDPRTSSIGLGFLLWSKVALPRADFAPFWKKMSQQVRTVSPGWSAGYGMFLKKEADFVVSYTTSPAYHIANEKVADIKAIEFSEGNYQQIEGVGILKTSKLKEDAKKFVTVLLSEEAQTVLPELQWMYPARKGVTLPASFGPLLKIKKAIHPPDLNEEKKREWLRDWTNLMAAAVP